MSERQQQEDKRYLLFLLGNELYGAPLGAIREVVEPQDPKTIPNTAKSFLGVINIRGKIVGVLDLRLKFDIEAQNGSDRALIVFETAAGPTAVLVDKVEAVVRVPDSDIERNPTVRTTVPLQYLIGIGKYKERLVTLVNLVDILDAEELTHMRAAY